MYVWAVWESKCNLAGSPHCSSASLCTWRSPAPPHLPTPRRALSPRTLRRTCLHASPWSASRWSQTTRSLTSTPSTITNTNTSETFTPRMTCLHLEYTETLTESCMLTLATRVLRRFCRWRKRLENYNTHTHTHTHTQRGRCKVLHTDNNS